jgi:hypothetical protein
MCRVTRHHIRNLKHHISTQELEAKLGNGHPRCPSLALCSFEGAEILRPRFSYGRRQTGLPAISPAALLAPGWWMASSLQVKPRFFTISLYRSRLTRRGPASLMPLTRASGITKPDQSARHPGFQPKLPPNGPLLSPRGLASTSDESRAAGASVAASESATCKPDSRRNLNLKAEARGRGPGPLAPNLRFKSRMRTVSAS